MNKTLSKVFFRIGFFLIIAFLAKIFLFQPFFMFDSGMEPSLVENRIYLINKFIYRLREPKRGEIIFFRTTGEPPLFFISRIIARPGEVLEIKEGAVFINQVVLREDYTKLNPNWNLDKIKIKENAFYVLGDNRKMDLSTHLHAQVARKNILGKVINKR